MEAFPAALPDGTAIILKKDNDIAVVFVTMQTSRPEQCQVRWMLRTDGKARFAPGSAGVVQGSAVVTGPVVIGPFSFRWSVAGDGFGWVYLDGDAFTGVVLGTTEEEIQSRIFGTVLIRGLTADRMILLPPMNQERR